jgi:hypothetical protein
MNRRISTSRATTATNSNTVKSPTTAKIESEISKSPRKSIEGEMGHATLFEQLIPSPYVDRRRLLYKLRIRFPGVDQNGKNKFKVQVCLPLPCHTYSFFQGKQYKIERTTTNGMIVETEHVDDLRAGGAERGEFQLV